MITNGVVFLGMTPCGLPEVYWQTFQRIVLPPSSGYFSTRRHVPEDSNTHRVTAMRTYKFRGLCLDMSIQLQAVIIGRGWNERKMRADKKEEMKTRKNGQQQVEFRGRVLWENGRMRNRVWLTQGLAYCRTFLCEPLRPECTRVTKYTMRLEHN